MQCFKTILYLADSASTAGPALERAVELATSNYARLTVIDMLDETASPTNTEQPIGLDLNQLLRDRREEALTEPVAPFVEADTIIYTRVETGAPFFAVIRAILRNTATIC